MTEVRPRFLPDLLSGADRDRTGDPLVANQVLSQLSYRPIRELKLTAQTAERRRARTTQTAKQRRSRTAELPNDGTTDEINRNATHADD